jgi:hypothetical protein
VLLIAGGPLDPHVASLLRRARERGVAHQALLSGGGALPAINWEVEADRLRVDGREARPSALYIRFDAYGPLADPRPETAQAALAWYETVRGWALAHPDVRLPNRRADPQVSKPLALMLAARAGLSVPATWLSNELDAVARDAAGRPMIAKPVNGGGFARELGALLAATERRQGKTAAPAFVQARLEHPEVRIYAAGGAEERRFEAFRIVSDALDYRAAGETPVRHLPPGSVPGEVLAGLGRVMDALALDWGAADFKTDPETGRLAFMEINSNPAFDAFDAASGHVVSDALLDHLTG